MADSTSIGKQYMELSRYEHMGPSWQKQGRPQPPLELPAPPDTQPIPLPSPQDVALGHVDLRQMIEQRVSLRKYGPDPLSLDELSFLLWCTQGVKQVLPRPSTLRTVPSAGARHAFETYVLANRVTGLEAGLYRFLALEHQLAPLNLSPGITDQITEACWRQEQVRQSAATFAWVAVLDRMYWRYDERSVRYLHLDAGHVCQNLYLAAESIGCGVCAIAAFYDEPLNEALGLDGVEQFVIYLGSVGRKTTA
jgi:SagB-type dehydrogenase family enzyme